MKKSDSPSQEMEVNQVNQKALSQDQSLRKSLWNFQKETTKQLSLSETMSLCSHLPQKYYDHFDIFLSRKISSREALTLALVVNHLDPLLKYALILDLEELCYTYQYEGTWSKVNTMIQLSEDEDKLFYFLYIENISDRELFGNYVRQIDKALKNVVFKDRRRQKVKRPQRKRGYNDHGSRRPDVKWLPKKIQLSENPQKIDLKGRNLKVCWEHFHIYERDKPGSPVQSQTQERRIANET